MSSSVGAAASTSALGPIDPATYRCHYLHAQSRTWRESNCAADLWIEALHSLGVDPTLALGFTLSTDFDGEQWQMFKFDPTDLRLLFGVEYDELNVWRELLWHLEQQLALGRLVTVDVDAWHLPDTAGLTYRCVHQKTTIMVRAVDRVQRRLGYFHNTGYYELMGEDFDNVLGLASADALPPYVESVHWRDLGASQESTAALARAMAAQHLARRPQTNPVSRMAERVAEDLQWIAQDGMDSFHRYAFGSLRQCGAGAELAASYADWLAAADPQISAGAEHLRTVATGMKSLEFLMARAVRGRSVDLDSHFALAAQAWERAMNVLEERCA